MRGPLLADLAIAAGLFVVATFAVASTFDMGFVRDEAFYFRHAETYQNWFTDVMSPEGITGTWGSNAPTKSTASAATRAAPKRGGNQGNAAENPALSREQIHKAWRNNAEHPPLSKVLMGWSWRIFGRKLRPTTDFSEGSDKLGKTTAAAPKTALFAQVGGLNKSHGFYAGSEVVLLSPQIVGESADTRGRELLRGTVVTREVWRAKIQLHGGDLKRLKTICKPAGNHKDGTIRRTGCESHESRPLYVMSESNAMRFPGALFAGLLVALMFLAARGRFLTQQLPVGPSRVPIPFAVLASLGFLLLPRPFYHAHLAAFDMATCTLLVATTCAYQRSLRSRWWVLIVAVLWGLSLLAKHNAAFLPIAFIGHWLWDGLSERRIHLTLPSGWRRWAWLAAGALALVGGGLVHPALGVAAALIVIAGKPRTLSLPPLPQAWFVMLPIGLLILVAGWPLLWHDTFDNFLRWLEFHLSHEHYMQEYFGQILAYPPFPVAFPWVMTALTWPVALLAACVVGVVVVAVGAFRWHLAAWSGSDQPATARTDAAAERRGWMRLVVLSCLWPTVLISLPNTPVFGGIKHWMPSYPWMLLLAAIGCWWMWRAVTAGLQGGRPVAAMVAWLIALIIAVPAAQATWEVHPHGTAYYNELIGGLPGAAQAGMQRQFWGGATRDGLEEVNRRAPTRARVWFHKAAWGAYMMYQREGWFRRDLSYGNSPSGTTHGLYHHQKDHDDYELECMDDYGVAAPVMRASIQGVPLLSVYERP
jgi:hypothetical protein